MLMGLKKKLDDGSSFKVEFSLNDGSKKKVPVMVLNEKLKENFINLKKILKYTNLVSFFVLEFYYFHLSYFLFSLISNLNSLNF